MVSDSKAYLKLRLLNSMYYRFGFDSGLAVIFDEEYQIISIGVHHKSTPISYGAKFNGKDRGFTVEEGVFDG